CARQHWGCLMDYW
nr:immunoglobulin heavy chain junction region [Mus musculus]